MLIPTVALVLLVAVPVKAQTPATIAPYVALIGGNIADLVTTHQAFGRGAYEGNALTGFAGTQQIAPLLVEKAAETVLVTWGMHYLARHGHPRVAKIMGYVAGGLTFAAAAHNARVAR